MVSSPCGGRAGVSPPLTLLMRLLVSMALFFLALPGEAQSLLVVRVEMTEFAFHPSVVRIDAGRPVKLILVNRGQIAHQFDTGYLRQVSTIVAGDVLRVEANGVDLVRLQPGGSATVTFLPQARGRFPFACTIEGHRTARLA